MAERRKLSIKQMTIKKTTQLISKIGLLVVALPPRAWIHDQASAWMDGATTKQAEPPAAAS
jgi:hypothetical protein